MKYRQWDPELEQVYKEVEQLFHSLQDARQERDNYRDLFVWQTREDQEGLYQREDGQYRFVDTRNGASEITMRKHELEYQVRQGRVERFKVQLQHYAEPVSEGGLARIPHVLGRVVRALRRDQIRHAVVGNHALSAYEARAGVTLPDQLFEPDQTSSLEIVATAPPEALLSSLQKADRSFSYQEHNGEPVAVNRAGFQVALTSRAPRQTISQHSFEVLLAHPMRRREVASPSWLSAAPAFEHVVCDVTGIPLLFRVPDPRAFLLHRLCVADQNNADSQLRNKVKLQALALAQLVVTRFEGMSLPYSLLKLKPSPKK